MRNLLVSLFLFVLGIGLASAAPKVGVTIKTSVDPDGSYRSLGTLTLPFPASQVEAKMLDFAGYSRWVPRGQDGNDPLSAKYVGQVTGARAVEGGLDFVYRLNLMWPFGASGKVVSMTVQNLPVEKGTVRRLGLSLKYPSFVVPVLGAEFSLTPKGPKESVVILDCRMKFAWFLAPFFPLDAYRVEMVQRFHAALTAFADDVTAK